MDVVLKNLVTFRLWIAKLDSLVELAETKVKEVANAIVDVLTLQFV